ncbi:MAG TPA: FkbM family methyltransferase [Puia sp.]
MNIRKLLYFHFNSSLARSILALFFKEDHFYKIPFGAIKGEKLYYRKDINFHSTMGVWEKDSLEVLNKLFLRFGLNQPDIVIADVGSNIGYYCLFFSKYLDPSARIFAFEPSTSILPVLRKNLVVNNVSNVKVLELALADHTGNEEFFLGQHHHESSLLREWSSNAVSGTKTTVATVTLDYFFENFNQGRYPDLIKMDIEGGGIFALKGCVNCLSRKRPFILIESHNPAEDEAVSHVLLQYNYEALRVNNNKWIKNKETHYPDPNGVWGTMLLMPAEKKPDFIN